MADKLRKRRPDLKFILGDVRSLLDLIKADPGDIFARRQLAERYATIERRTTHSGRGS
jgi:hypothetical protein